MLTVLEPRKDSIGASERQYWSLGKTVLEPRKDSIGASERQYWSLGKFSETISKKFQNITIV